MELLLVLLSEDVVGVPDLIAVGVARTDRPTFAFANQFPLAARLTKMSKNNSRLKEQHIDELNNRSQQPCVLPFP